MGQRFGTMFTRQYPEEIDYYKVPVYYILGRNDWQAPYVIAQEYLEGINAPYKKLYLIPMLNILQC